MNNKTKLLNLAFVHFVSSEELWRSWRVLTLSASHLGQNVGLET